jgi:hypothetical protein
VLPPLNSCSADTYDQATLGDNGHPSREQARFTTVLPRSRPPLLRIASVSHCPPEDSSTLDTIVGFVVASDHGVRKMVREPSSRLMDIQSAKHARRGIYFVVLFLHRQMNWACDFFQRPSPAQPRTASSPPFSRTSRLDYHRHTVHPAVPLQCRMRLKCCVDPLIPSMPIILHSSLGVLILQVFDMTPLLHQTSQPPECLRATKHSIYLLPYPSMIRSTRFT